MGLRKNWSKEGHLVEKKRNQGGRAGKKHNLQKSGGGKQKVDHGGGATLRRRIRGGLKQEEGKTTKGRLGTKA